MSLSKKYTEDSMFYGAAPYLFRYAKKLRNNPTKAESLLWDKLKQKQLGFKFRRQHPVYKYIADFYCHKLKLIIEIDGDYHNETYQKEYDIFRQYPQNCVNLNFHIRVLSPKIVIN
jgi:cyclase